MSADGLSKLEVREALIDGLYDDVSGYGTYGVGHLVHSSDKWKSFLLESAQSDKLCESRVKKKCPAPHTRPPTSNAKPSPARSMIN